jgi:leucyl-tRNA synthetase
LYSRFWNKFLKDRGYVNQEEPFKKLINQGMILGMSAYAYAYSGLFSTTEGSEGSSRKNLFLSKGILELINQNIKLFSDLWKTILQTDEEIIKRYNVDSEKLKKIKEIYNVILLASQEFGFLNIDWNYVFPVMPIHVDISIVNDVTNELEIEKFKNHLLNKNYQDAIFIGENGEIVTNNNGKFIVGREVEKMSKSKYNVVTPDDICEEYGADTLRLYEMFLGPLEQAKPWNTAGISGVFGFLKRLWKLYFDESGLIVTSNPASAEALKTLHKTIKKVNDDIEGFSFNTSVSQFMIAVNELTAMKCHERSILEPLAILISPYAPHIAEELWEKLGHQMSISTVSFPIFNPEYLVESNKEYPVSFNGKMRFTMNLPLDLTKEQIEAIVMQDERTIKQLEGRIPNKVIIVPGKIINLVG